MAFINISNPFGITADILSLLSGSIKKLAEKEAEYWECSERLIWYGYQMSECRGLMRKWTSLWCPLGKPFTEDEYKYLWSEEGYKEILARVEQIRREDGNIQDKLRGNGLEPLKNAQQPSPDDWKAWVQQCQPHSKHVGSRLNAARKVSFAITGSKILKEKILSIREKVDSLSVYSRMMFFEMQDAEDIGLGIGQYVVKLPHLIKRVKTFSRFMDGILEQHSTDSECIRHLILDIPEDEEALSCFHCVSCFHQELDIQTRFVAETSLPDSSLKIEALTFSYESDGQWDTDTPAEAEAEMIPAELQRGPMLFSSNSSLAEWKSGEMNRARTSIGLVNWTLLLAQTDWVADLSIRRIHYVTYYTSATSEQAKFTCSVLEPVLVHNKNSGQKPNVLKRPLLLLAITLAELAMGCSIEVRLDNNVVKEYMAGFIGLPQSWSEEKMLREVVRKSRSSQYRGAIKSCLELDRKMQRRGERVEDIELWIEKILAP